MSLTLITVPMANGVTSVPLNSGAIGQFEITLNDSAGAPSAGTLKIEGLNWSGNYDVIEGATAIPLTQLATGVINVSDFGHFQALRLTLSGVVGGVGQIYGAANVQTFMLPDYVATGGRAGYQHAELHRVQHQARHAVLHAVLQCQPSRIRHLQHRVHHGQQDRASERPRALHERHQRVGAVV